MYFELCGKLHRFIDKSCTHVKFGYQYLSFEYMFYALNLTPSCSRQVDFGYLFWSSFGFVGVNVCGVQGKNYTRAPGDFVPEMQKKEP